MLIFNKFDIGQIVYLRTDEDQMPRIITEISIRHDNFLVYQLSCGTVNSFHYEMEISEEKNILSMTGDVRTSTDIQI